MQKIVEAYALAAPLDVHGIEDVRVRGSVMRVLHQVYLTVPEFLMDMELGEVMRFQRMELESIHAEQERMLGKGKGKGKGNERGMLEYPTDSDAIQIIRPRSGL